MRRRRSNRASPTPISPPGWKLRELRAVAELALADPRTVARRIRGEPVRGDVGDRIDVVLAARAHEPRADSLTTMLGGRP